MALVKKGSRLITVDGVGYRWRVRGRPTYSQGIGQTGLTFAVERVDLKGSVLVVTMPVLFASGSAIFATAGSKQVTLRLTLAGLVTKTPDGRLRAS